MTSSPVTDLRRIAARTYINAAVELGENELRVRVVLIDPVVGDPRTPNELRQAALRRAVEKRFGRGTFLQPDSGVPGYGQVFRSCSDGVAASVTGRLSYRITLAPIPESHSAALNQRAADLKSIYREIDATERAAAADAIAGRPMRQVGEYQYEYEQAYWGMVDGIELERESAARAAEFEARELARWRTQSGN